VLQKILVYFWFMSRCHNKDILNNVIFASQMSLLMTVVINMHKPYFIFKTCVMPVLCTPLQVKFLMQSKFKVYGFF